MSNICFFCSMCFIILNMANNNFNSVSVSTDEMFIQQTIIMRNVQKAALLEMYRPHDTKIKSEV